MVSYHAGDCVCQQAVSLNQSGGKKTDKAGLVPSNNSSPVRTQEITQEIPKGLIQTTPEDHTLMN